MTRRTRIAIAVVLALLGLRLLLPFVIGSVLESQASAALGRPVLVDDVKLTLWRGAASIGGIQIGTDTFKGTQATANLAFLSLLGGKIHLESFQLVDPAVAVRLLKDGTIEPLILASKAPEAEPDPREPEAAGDGERAEESGGWPLLIDELSIENLSVLVVPSEESQGLPAELALGRLSLREFSIVEGALDFGSIELSSPRVTVQRQLANVPASDAPGDAAPKPEPETTAEQAAEPAASGGGLSIEGSDFTIEDAQLAVQVGDEEVMVNVDFSVRDVRTSQGETFPIRLRTQRKEGWLEFKGVAGAQPGVLKGTLELEGLPLENVLYVTDPTLAPRVEKGVLGGKLEVDVLLHQGQLDVSLDGGLSIAALAVNAEGRRLSAGSARLKADDLRVSRSKTGDLDIGAGAMSLELDELTVTDETVDPVTHVEFREVRVQADSPRWPKGDLSLDVTFQGLGSFAGDAKSRLVSGEGRSDIEITGVPLGSLSGYARGGGFLLNAGQASVEGGVDSAGTAHDASLQLSVDGLEIETIDAGTFEKLFGMSPDLALAVLQDASGGVSLPLGFEVDTGSGDTDISLAQLMTGAVRQALTGIVSMPLKGLGSVARGVLGDDGGLQMEPVAFEPGSSDWMEGEEEYVAAIARTLVSRNRVGAKIIGRALEDEARRPERLAEKRAKAVSKALVDAGVDRSAIEIAPGEVGETGVVIEMVPRPENPEGD